MSYVTLSPLPGICKVDSAYTNSFKGGQSDEKVAIGRFTDMQNCRFIASMPEKIGGWQKKYNSQQLDGIPRGQKTWRDLSQNIYGAIGTNSKLYVHSVAGIVDITPFREISTGTLTNAITTSIGSSEISIADTAHGQKVGDYVYLTASAAVGGLTITTVKPIKTVTDADNYVVDIGIAATSSVSGGGGTLTYKYYRITLTSPFTTTAGSDLVSVAHTTHGASSGDFVQIDDAVAVGGITLDGEYEILTTTTNSYTVRHSSNASSSVSGGGGSPTFNYNISSGLTSAASASGYGIGGYGKDSGGGYGTTEISSISVGARVWFLDNYGQQLYACPYAGTIYVWDPTVGGRAFPLYGAPTGILGMFITPERYVFALGNSGNYLQVKWPDQEDSTDWVAAADNTANARTLQNGSYLVGGISVRDGASLCYTNNSAYTFIYNGGDFIYDSTALGDNTGLAGPLSVASDGGNAYWMSTTDFWTWNGAAYPLPSDDIRDYVFKDINWHQRSKFFACTNRKKKEVWFWYCSDASDEIDRYAIYHIDQQCFSIGNKSRTTMMDATLFQYPISADANGYIYDEEYGLNGDGSAIETYIKFSPTVIGSGSTQIDLMGFLPDFQRQLGDITVEVLTQNYPKDNETVSLTMTINEDETNNVEDPRESARMIGYKVTSNAIDGDFRLGMCQVDIIKSAQRR